MHTLEVFNPCGATQVTASFAPRLETLDGKTIGVLNNGHWQAHRTLPFVQDLLAQQYPTAQFVSVSPAGGKIDDEQVVDGLVRAGCDAVIVGHAS